MNEIKRGWLEVGRQSDVYVSPYWSHAEILRYAAVALGTKRLSNRNVSKQLDEYVSSKIYQYEKYAYLLDEAILVPAKEIFPVSAAAKKYFVEKMKSDFDYFFYKYNKTLNKISGIGCARKDFNPLMDVMVRHTLIGVFLRERQIIVGKEIKLDLKCSAFKNVLSWIKEEIPEALDEYLKLPVADPSMIAKWKVGESIPLLRSLAPLAQCISASTTRHDLVGAACLALFYAHVIDYLVKDNGGRNLYEFLKEHGLQGDMDYTLGEIVKVKKAKEKNLCGFFNLIKFLETSKSNRKLSQHEFKVIFQRIKLQCIDENAWGACCCLPMWVEGKYQVLCGDLDLARQFYKKAFEFSLYLGGDIPSKIISEAMVVAAAGKRPDRSFLKKLKNHGVATGLYNYLKVDQPDPLIGTKKSRAKDCVVEDWEVDQLRESFFDKFPRNTFFDESDAKQFEVSGGAIIILEGDIKPDFRNPNKVIQISRGKAKRIPQLVYFSMLNRVEIVKKLLSKGASLCRMTKEGESAFFLGLQKMNLVCSPPIEKAEPELFEILYCEAKKLYEAGSKDLEIMIHTPLLKKKTTVLHCAIETGEPSVVAKVIGLGADIEQKSELDQLTPLYVCLQTLFQRKYQNKFKQKMKMNSLFMPESLLKDARRRWTNVWDVRLPSRVEKCLEEMGFCQLLESYKLFNSEKLYQIAELLLEKGASPNSRCDIGVLKDFTPLMFAVEYDDARMVELLLSYGGDTSLKCYVSNTNTWFSCSQIALRWNSREVLKIFQKDDFF